VCLEKVRALLSPLRSDFITSLVAHSSRDYSTEAAFLTTLTCASPLLSSSLCNSKIIMRFAAIAVTVVTLAAQVTLTTSAQPTNAGQGQPTTGGFNCKEELDPCMEVKISSTDPCNGNTVTYCLQPKSDAPTWCKSHPSNTETYSHANVYVNGNMVNVTDQTALPAASCSDVGVNKAACEFKSTDGGANSCYALDGFPSFDQTTTNVGLKCEAVSKGLCVTVPLDKGSHAEIVFAVKDESGCNTTAAAQTDLWKCSSSTEGGGNSCACSGSQTACYRDGITSCPFIDPVCGDGNLDAGEGCDDGNNVGGDGCSATCQREVCGNGVVDVGEECDDGNNVSHDGCSATCQDDNTCGDDIVEPGEECDGGLHCNPDCTRAPYCGDGILQSNEQCDPPQGSSQDGCVECIITSQCGDGVIEYGEECDPLPTNDSCHPTTCQTIHGGGVQGDPHFKTWAGQRYDFHGECDLILFQSSKFKAGLGVDLHIRTTLRHDMSYISSAALRIGKDVLEVESRGVYYLNGVLGAAMPNKISGFPIAHSHPNANQRALDVDLGDGTIIKIKTYKDFVSVMVDGAQSKDFGDSIGLMGALEKGVMLARDGKTVLKDHNAFGLEWQVLDTEPKIFQTARFPQYPQGCTMPPPARATSLLRRRLSESKGAELAAEKACAHWGEGKDDCVFDVLTTGDLEMALVGAY
jgi:cysteine-rich repeat protein